MVRNNGRGRRAAGESDYSRLSSELGPIRDKLGHLLRRATLLAHRDFAIVSSEFGIAPTEYGILATLDHSPGLRQKYLADVMAIKPANCTVMIDKLAARGLVRRTTLAVGGRAVSVSLTPQGQALLTRLKKALAVHERRLLRRLGPAETKELVRLLKDFIVGREAEKRENR